MNLRKKIVLTTLLSILILTFFITPIANLCSKTFQLKEIDKVSENYLHDTLKKTSVSFLAARGVNAIVSLIQSIDTGGSAKVFGTGVSGNISPGQILDPLNDMVERFSWVMLASSISIGIQMFFMKILPWLCSKYLIPLSFIIMIIVLWSNKSINSKLYRSAIKLILIAIILRFFIPTMAYTNEIVYSYALEDKYSTSIKYIKKQEKMSKVEDKESILDKIKNLKSKIAYLQEKANKLFEHLIDLLIVFVIQTIILPLVTLWMFLSLIKYLINKTEPFQIEQFLKAKIVR